MGAQRITAAPAEMALLFCGVSGCAWRTEGPKGGLGRQRSRCPGSSPVVQQRLLLKILRLEVLPRAPRQPPGSRMGLIQSDERILVPA